MSLFATETPQSKQKLLGAFYTPPEVARTLVRWVIRSNDDRLLDPSCGDGRFLAEHLNVVGVDRDGSAVATVAEQVPHATIHAAEFFDWASNTNELFDCVAGNPPFIRYQQFSGEIRKTALRLCSEAGASLNGLTSSWAPFVVVSASMLKPGGRLAFVVPAEIGHAPYARPMIHYLMQRFSSVHVVAVREKIFPEISEDVWLLYAAGAGGSTDEIAFSSFDSFRDVSHKPPRGTPVAADDLKSWNDRLRSFLLPEEIRAAYKKLSNQKATVRLGECARVGIGYVTGANNFFHLRKSDAEQLGIPDDLLVPTVRRSSFLPSRAVTHATVSRWRNQDEPVFLLRIPTDADVPEAVQRYLDSKAGQEARTGYKCRKRTPWYSVPDVRVPDAFLSYMSGIGPSLVANHARCVCTNSIHAVQLTNGMSVSELQQRWGHAAVPLSCEVEGHPLGGGMLKLEPGEAARIALPSIDRRVPSRDREMIEEGVRIMRRWRHYA